VVVPVAGGAGNAAEEVAGAYSPAVVSDRRDLGARISPQLEHVDGVEELVEQHPFTCPYLLSADCPGAGVDRPSPRPRVSPRWADDLPDGEVVGGVDGGGSDDADVLGFLAVVDVVDFGRVVVVVVLVVVGFGVVPLEPLGLVVVVVDDFEVDDFEVDDFEVDDFEVVGFEVGGGVEVLAPDALAVVVVVEARTVDFVVGVVDAAGTLGSSLAGVSSRAWPGVPAAGGGATAGGGIRSSRRAYCMIRAKTGADT
jgi:hypothetical protein